MIAVFAAAALLGARNLTVASLVLLPAMAAAAPPVGSLRSLGSSPAPPGLLAVGGRGRHPPRRPRSAWTSPTSSSAATRSTRWPTCEEEDVDLEAHHMAAPDIVGNLLELLYGPGERVFYDDRFDMFPDRRLRRPPGLGASRARSPCGARRARHRAGGLEPLQRHRPAPHRGPRLAPPLHRRALGRCSAAVTPTSAAPSAAADGGRFSRAVMLQGPVRWSMHGRGEGVVPRGC